MNRRIHDANHPRIEPGQIWMRVRSHGQHTTVFIATQIMEVKDVVDEFDRVRVRYASGRHRRIPVTEFRAGSAVVLATEAARIGSRFVLDQKTGRLRQSHQRQLVFSGAKSDKTCTPRSRSCVRLK